MSGGGARCHLGVSEPDFEQLSRGGGYRDVGEFLVRREREARRVPAEGNARFDPFRLRVEQQKFVAGSARDGELRLAELYEVGAEVFFPVVGNVSVDRRGRFFGGARRERRKERGN